MNTNKKLSDAGRRLRSGRNHKNCENPKANDGANSRGKKVKRCCDDKSAKTKCTHPNLKGLRQQKNPHNKEFNSIERFVPLQQITDDLHKMEKEMNSIDFSFLEVEKLNTQLENESLELQLKFLQGE